MDVNEDKEDGIEEQDTDNTTQATNSQADKTTAVNPMKELRIEKLVISQSIPPGVKRIRKLMK
jgi:hypothetical protein